jgi:hypothetical protein
MFLIGCGRDAGGPFSWSVKRVPRARWSPPLRRLLCSLSLI